MFEANCRWNVQLTFLGKLTYEGLPRSLAEQGTKQKVEVISLQYSSLLVPTPGMDCSQPFIPIEKVDFPLQTSRFSHTNLWEHIPSTSIVLSGT